MRTKAKTSALLTEVLGEPTQGQVRLEQWPIAMKMATFISSTSNMRFIIEFADTLTKRSPSPWL
jgi:hypothetical protein